MALNEERVTTFPKEGLTQIIFSNLYPDVPLPRLREIKTKIRKIPDLLPNFDKYHYTREQSILRGITFGKAWKSFMDKEKLNLAERRLVLAYAFDLNAFNLHYDFFLPSLELQASPAQKSEWLPRFESLEFIGCYAQTEIAHGSNVRGIEIEARYDHATSEFIFHSPSITATKWWVGGLGLISTHALLIARLIIKGQDYGPHPFLVSIRDPKTHQTFTGVDAGDIGPKMGLPSTDNGYIRFDNYRQPKSVLLNRFATINDSGDYEILDTNSIKILYLSLIRARAIVVYDSWYYLGKALTIAIRYSLVREQFPDPENPLKERKILNYQMQKFKLFRGLARLYSFLFVTPYVRSIYNEAEGRLKAGDDSLLGYLHCIVSLFKSYFTFNGVDHIEEARRSCGGHGFLMLSGLPSIYTEMLPSITYDGDNSILILQASRFIMSQIRSPKKTPEDLAFLNNSNETLSGDPTCPLFHQRCLEVAARLKLKKLFKKEQNLIIKGARKEVIWNRDLQVEAIEACEVVYTAIVHKQYTKGIEQLQDQSIKEAIEMLRRIYATDALQKFSGDLAKAGVKFEYFEKFTEVQIDALNNTRKNALGLIECFEMDDDMLNSVIGKSDGSIYTSMIRTSRYLNPLNKDPVFPGIKELLKPKL